MSTVVRRAISASLAGSAAVSDTAASEAAAFPAAVSKTRLEALGGTLSEDGPDILTGVTEYLLRPVFQRCQIHYTTRAVNACLELEGHAPGDRTRTCVKRARAPGGRRNCAPTDIIRYDVIAFLIGAAVHLSCCRSRPERERLNARRTAHNRMRYIINYI